MAGQAIAASTADETLASGRVYAMAGLCLLVGLAIGYMLRASQPPAPAPASLEPAASVSTRAVRAGRIPSLEEMKQMADTKAAPLLEKLKREPNNSALLAQVGAVYHAAHQFRQAAGYYDRAVRLDSGNVALRTKLAASLYRAGDADAAIAELNRALNESPNDADALFDLGMIQLKGKQDGKGALAAWQRLLKTNPQLSADHKAEVQALMAQVTNSPGNRGREGARNNGGKSSNSR
jgi:cytochrome c-type biogenesis protein CcmH/NrfG